MKDYFDEAGDEVDEITEDERLMRWLRETARRLDARIDGELDVRGTRELVKERARRARPAVGAGARSGTRSGVEASKERSHSPDRLLKAAALGDGAAWSDIVDEYQRLVWSVVRGFGLSAADAADASQTTWLRLVENLGRIRDPEHLAAWLATTARREAMRLLRLGRREIPDADVFEYVALGREAEDAGEPDAALLAEESRESLWSAFETLPERCRTMLRMMAATPPESYTTVAEALGMPMGSVGPTRSRCLEHLRGAMRDRDGASGCGAADRGRGQGNRR